MLTDLILFKEAYLFRVSHIKAILLKFIKNTFDFLRNENTMILCIKAIEIKWASTIDERLQYYLYH